MPVEDIILQTVGFPALLGIIMAIICVYKISKKPYIVILFAILGILVGLGAGKILSAINAFLG